MQRGGSAQWLHTSPGRQWSGHRNDSVTPRPEQLRGAILANALGRAWRPPLVESTRNPPHPGPMDSTTRGWNFLQPLHHQGPVAQDHRSPGTGMDFWPRRDLWKTHVGAASWWRPRVTPGAHMGCFTPAWVSSAEWPTYHSTAQPLRPLKQPAKGSEHQQRGKGEAGSPAPQPGPALTVGE